MPLAAVLAGVMAGGACGGGADEVELASFCASWAEAVCEVQARCDCGEAGLGSDTATCLEMAPLVCPLAAGMAMRAAIDGGEVVYDSEAAGRYLARLAQSSCELTSVRDEATLGELVTWFGTIEGTLAPGESCTPGAMPDRCRRGLCDPDRGVCFALVGRGEGCDELHACDEPVSGDPADRLFCTVDGVCEPLQGEGEPCRGHDECATGRCDDERCVAKLPDGEGCGQDSECESGRCDFGTGRCRPPERDGDLCAEHEDCASGWCADRLELGAGMCRSPLADGAECTESAACVSGACVRGRCAAAACGLP